MVSIELLFAFGYCSLFYNFYRRWMTDCYLIIVTIINLIRNTYFLQLLETEMARKFLIIISINDLCFCYIKRLLLL